MQKNAAALIALMTPLPNIAGIHGSRYLAGRLLEMMDLKGRPELYRKLQKLREKTGELKNGVPAREREEKDGTPSSGTGTGK